MIKQINPNNAGRSRDVAAKFIKYADIIISEHLSELFNICLFKSVCRDEIKIAETVPKSKRSHRKLATNYHPI